MPTYRYECAKCEKIHEIFHSISEPPKKKCPDCGGKLTRLIGTGGGVILKGAGFYTTDYRSDSYRKAEKKESDAPKAANEGGGESKGSESTKAEKSEKSERSEKSEKSERSERSEKSEKKSAETTRKRKKSSD